MDDVETFIVIDVGEKTPGKEREKKEEKRGPGDRDERKKTTGWAGHWKRKDSKRRGRKGRLVKLCGDRDVRKKALGRGKNWKRKKKLERKEKKTSGALW